MLIAIGGYEWAFAFNAASFLAVILAVTQLRLPPPVVRRAQSIRAEIREGIAYVRRDPGLRVVVAYMVVNSLLAAPFIALVAAMAEKVFHAGASGTAVLVTAQGIGAVTMALSLAALAARFGNGRVLLDGALGAPARARLRTRWCRCWRSPRSRSSSSGSSTSARSRASRASPSSAPPLRCAAGC